MIKYIKLREYTKHFSNLLRQFFTSRVLIMRKSAKKSNNHRFRRFREQLVAET